jgi:hypothetical protein
MTLRILLGEPCAHLGYSPTCLREQALGHDTRGWNYQEIFRYKSYIGVQSLRWKRNAAIFATPCEFPDAESKLQPRLFGSALPRCGWVVAVVGIPTGASALFLRALGHRNRNRHRA